MADLSGAELRGANLTDAKLNGANLQGADLRGAELRDAQLYKADFTHVRLWRGQLSEEALKVVMGLQRVQWLDPPQSPSSKA
jgi:uncharacterized protein YjbI with pentapeptide repeats